MNLDEALRLFRTVPADEHPGGLAECAALVLGELDRRGAAIERVRELHSPETYNALVYCRECSHESVVQHPCPTIQALDDPPAG